MAKLLLEENVLLESKSEDGLTPLLYIAREGHEVVVKLQLERGALLEYRIGVVRHRYDIL